MSPICLHGFTLLQSRFRLCHNFLHFMFLPEAATRAALLQHLNIGPISEMCVILLVPIHIIRLPDSDSNLIHTRNNISESILGFDSREFSNSALRQVISQQHLFTAQNKQNLVSRVLRMRTASWTKETVQLSSNM